MGDLHPLVVHYAAAFALVVASVAGSAFVLSIRRDRRSASRLRVPSLSFVADVEGELIEHGSVVGEGASLRGACSVGGWAIRTGTDEVCILHGDARVVFGATQDASRAWFFGRLESLTHELRPGDRVKVRGNSDLAPRGRATTSYRDGSAVVRRFLGSPLEPLELSFVGTPTVRVETEPRAARAVVATTFGFALLAHAVAGAMIDTEEPLARAGAELPGASISPIVIAQIVPTQHERALEKMVDAIDTVVLGSAPTPDPSWTERAIARASALEPGPGCGVVRWLAWPGDDFVKRARDVTRRCGSRRSTPTANCDREALRAFDAGANDLVAEATACTSSTLAVSLALARGQFERIVRTTTDRERDLDWALYALGSVPYGPLPPMRDGADGTPASSPRLCYRAALAGLVAAPDALAEKAFLATFGRGENYCALLAYDAHPASDGHPPRLPLVAFDVLREFAPTKVTDDYQAWVLALSAEKSKDGRQVRFAWPRPVRFLVELDEIVASIPIAIWDELSRTWSASVSPSWVAGASALRAGLYAYFGRTVIARSELARAQEAIGNEVANAHEGTCSEWENHAHLTLSAIALHIGDEGIARAELDKACDARGDAKNALRATATAIQALKSGQPTALPSEGPNRDRSALAVYLDPTARERHRARGKSVAALDAATTFHQAAIATVVRGAVLARAPFVPNDANAGIAWSDAYLRRDAATLLYVLHATGKR